MDKNDIEDELQAIKTNMGDKTNSERIDNLIDLMIRIICEDKNEDDVV